MYYDLHAISDSHLHSHICVATGSPTRCELLARIGLKDENPLQKGASCSLVALGPQHQSTVTMLTGQASSRGRSSFGILTAHQDWSRPTLDLDRSREWCVFSRRFRSVGQDLPQVLHELNSAELPKLTSPLLNSVFAQSPGVRINLFYDVMRICIKSITILIDLEVKGAENTRK